MAIKQWGVKYYRYFYTAVSRLCFKKKLYLKNPFLRVIGIEKAISTGVVKFSSQGTTYPKCNKLPDLYIDDEYQVSHLKNYSADGREWNYKYGVIEIENGFFSYPYSIHRVGWCVIDKGMGDVLHYLCEPRYLLGYLSTFFPFRKKIDAAIMFALPSHENFYHWLIETLPRFQMLSKDSRFNDLPIMLPKKRVPKFIIDTIKLCGLSKRVQYIDSGSYSVKKLYMPTLYSPRNEPCDETVSWLNEKILSDDNIASCEINISDYRKIYISRDDADSRGVINSESVDHLLEKLGFKKIKMTDYNIKVQAYIFNQAEIIVGLHGAALSNIVFTKPGCTFIEIFMEGWFTRAFFNLARLRNITYGYLLCKKKNNGIYIETEKLKELIARAGN